MTRRRDTIPTELTALPRWVLWRRELVDGRLTKIPYQCNGRRASVKAPATWTSWTRVQIAFDRGGFAGVGIVLNGDGLVGVDFDDCVVDGVIADKIVAHVSALDSYTEISPSGSGLRVFLFGTLPPQDRRIGKIEVYETARFLSVTGQHLAGTPLTVNERQAALDAFHAEVFAERTASHNRVHPPRITSIITQSDEKLIDLIRRSAHGQKFFRIYDEGAWEAYYPDDRSKADAWLFARLMHWTNYDEARVLRLLWRSKMVRPKWDRDDYMERTMECARG
jgi:putative DNA primase/helicase